MRIRNTQVCVVRRENISVHQQFSRELEKIYLDRSANRSFTIETSNRARITYPDFFIRPRRIVLFFVFLFVLERTMEQVHCYNEMLSEIRRRRMHVHVYGCSDCRTTIKMPLKDLWVSAAPYAPEVRSVHLDTFKKILTLRCVPQHHCEDARTGIGTVFRSFLFLARFE